jgi:hypothetical protein
MYSRRTGLILGFHGCDQSLVDEVVAGNKQLKNSTNSYDWLGNGIYFWDHSPSRALDFAKEMSRHPKFKNKVKNPAVIGAVIDLGFCLDLLDYSNLELIKQGYELLASFQNQNMPMNEPAGNSTDLLLRHLDCAVIETLHATREDAGSQPFDSVRGVFFEGKELYDNAGFKEKDHIQLCVRNPNCIKGYFLPRSLNSDFTRV